MPHTLPVVKTQVNNETNKINNMETNQVKSKTPRASEFVNSPLRNRIQLELDVPVSEVWKLVGDHARMPEYSEGLQKVTATFNPSGKCEEYVCFFKPLDAGGEEIIHKALVIWYEPNVGWASVDEEPNAFDLLQSLSLVTLLSERGKTILNWDMHFTSGTPEMVQMNKSSLEQALDDISGKLIDRFGGRILNRFVEEN